MPITHGVPEPASSVRDGRMHWGRPTGIICWRFPGYLPEYPQFARIESIWLLEECGIGSGSNWSTENSW